MKISEGILNHITVKLARNKLAHEKTATLAPSVAVLRLGNLIGNSIAALMPTIMGLADIKHHKDVTKAIHGEGQKSIMKMYEPLESMRQKSGEHKEAKKRKHDPGLNAADNDIT